MAYTDATRNVMTLIGHIFSRFVGNAIDNETQAYATSGDDVAREQVDRLVNNRTWYV